MKTNRGAVLLNQFFQKVGDGAKQTNVSSSQFSLILSGKRMPSIELAAKIEKIWGVPCKYWVEEVTIWKEKKDKK